MMVETTELALTQGLWGCGKERHGLKKESVLVRGQRSWVCFVHLE